MVVAKAKAKPRATAKPEPPLLQFSLFGQDAYVCPFCCTFLSFAGGASLLSARYAGSQYNTTGGKHHETRLYLLPVPRGL